MYSLNNWKCIHERFFISMVSRCNCIAPLFQRYLRFYQRTHVCVCSCDECKDSENMKKDEIVCVCRGGCVRALRLRLCLFYRMVEHWILSSEQCFENGTQRLKRTSEKCNIPFADIMLSSTIRSMLKWRLICICLLLLTFLSPHFVHATITLRCLLAATHHFPSALTQCVKWRLCRMGEKCFWCFTSA